MMIFVGTNVGTNVGTSVGTNFGMNVGTKKHLKIVIFYVIIFRKKVFLGSRVKRRSISGHTKNAPAFIFLWLEC